jgi:hypothetical protein
MGFYFATSMLWLALGFLLVMVPLLDRATAEVVRKIGADWLPIIGASVLVCLALATSPYWGLEYEDAFEYEYAARLFGHGGIPEHPELNPVCLEGSLKDCQAIASLSHPSGLAVLGSWFVRSRERSPSGTGLVPALSLAALLLSAIVLSIFIRQATGNRISMLCAVAAFLATPELTLHFGTGFAEPFSTALILVAATSLWRLLNGAPPTKGVLVLTSGLISVAVALSILCKREGILAATVMLFTASLWWLVQARLDARSSLRIWCTGATICGLLIALLLGGTSLFSLESIGPAERWPFSFSNVARIGPHYAAYLFGSPALACLGFLSVLTLFLGQRLLAVYGFSFLLPFMLLFTAFDSDYYTVVHGEVPQLHFERYTTQIAPFLAMLAGLASGSLVSRVRRSYLHPSSALRHALSLAVLTIVGWSAWQIRMERVERHREEVEMRLRPASMACAWVDGDGVILTPQPVVIGVACKATQEVVDVTAIGQWVEGSRLLNRALKSDDVYLLEFPMMMGDLAERYPWAAKSLGRLRFALVPEYGGSAGGSRLLRLVDK